MRHVLALALTFVLALAHMPAMVAAQEPTTGSVTGTVTANTGRRLSGITIQVRNAAGAVIGSAVTKNDGTFEVTGMSVGSYTLECIGQKNEVLGTARLDMALPTTTQNMTCASDIAGLPILNKKLLAALGAAAVALGAVAVVSTQGDGSPAR